MGVNILVFYRNITIFYVIILIHPLTSKIDGKPSIDRQTKKYQQDLVLHIVGSLYLYLEKDFQNVLILENL